MLSDFAFMEQWWFFPETVKKPDSVICFYAKCLIMLFCFKKQTKNQKNTKQQKKDQSLPSQKHTTFFPVCFYFIFPC